MRLNCADLYRQEETPQLFLFQSKQHQFLLFPFLGHILQLCSLESTGTINASNMTVNLRRQPDSSESKRYNSDGLSHREMCVCMHTLFLPKHTGSAQQPKCHQNTVTGVKFSSSYPSHCLLSVLSALVSPPLGTIQHETLLQARGRGKVAVGTLTLNFLHLERLKSQFFRARQHTSCAYRTWPRQAYWFLRKRYTIG